MCLITRDLKTNKRYKYGLKIFYYNTTGIKNFKFMNFPKYIEISDREYNEKDFRVFYTKSLLRDEDGNIYKTGFHCFTLKDKKLLHNEIRTLNKLRFLNMRYILVKVKVKNICASGTNSTPLYEKVDCIVAKNMQLMEAYYE